MSVISSPLAPHDSHILVTNAAEAIGPDEQGTVLVRTAAELLTESELAGTVVRNSLQPGDYVCLEVRDTGSGMDADTLQRVFDPFFTTKFTGRGLGLSAVLGIVRSHKGTIQVRSEPGNGSTFTVYLPASRRATSASRSGAPKTAAAPGGLVLVIDDEETIRRTAKAILERRGYRVVLAGNGHAGVEVFQRFSDRISLVVIDLTMPLMDGMRC